MTDSTIDRLYFRQLLSGRDFARTDQVARQMVNFCYLIGDRESGECLVVDPAYGVDEIIDVAEADGMHITGALVTHYHADHCGGSMMGYEIEGAAELVGRCGCPVHVQTDELPWIQRTTQLSETDLVGHSGGDTVMVGDIPVQLLHTPGHTPGSQCFLVDGRLVAGDTLFLEGCGRTDLPGGDPEELYRSLHGVLATVPDNTVLFPGHQYSIDPSAPLGDVRTHNFVFRPKSAQEWLAAFGH
jgi:glyoxylase-like metal-dependent hydrolase (beta-lactamase superfamily II)